MFTNSIRWRFQLWLAFLLLCVLTGFGVAVYQLQRLNLLNQADEELGRRVAALTAVVRGGPPPNHGPGRPSFDNGPAHSDRPEPGPDSPDHREFGPSNRNRRGPSSVPDYQVPPEIAALFDESQTNGFYLALWYRDGTLVKQSANLSADVKLPKRSRGTDIGSNLRMNGENREMFHYTELGDCVLAGRSIVPGLNALRHFAWLLLAAGGAVLALGLGGGWWLTSSAFRPLEEISAAATRISAGKLSERINTANPENEFGRLAAVLNSTFARLEAAFVRQKQFTADAAHELRTPLAVIITEAQTTLARNREAAEYRETVEACLDTAQQMRKLTDSLLELARFDADQESPVRTNLDLAKLTRVCVGQITPLAKQHGIKINSDLSAAPCSASAELINQVITNLLSNAIFYNKPEGEIHIRTGVENGVAMISVADTGQGIAPEDLPHIFDRFFRADKSRARAEGHSGLGLAICKAIVDAAGGSIDATSQPGKGSTFTVRLPSK